MTSTRIISLDIETYGAVSTNAWAQPLPPQTTFHPARAIATDGVAQRDLVVTCAITLVNPTCKQEDLSLLTISDFEPGETIVLNLTDTTTHATLAAWLCHAHTIVGMNLPFDILWLRAFSPVIALALNGRHTLIDLSVVNFLHSELRPERSLKSLGPVLGTHAYAEDKSLKGGHRYPSPTSPDLQNYNAQDTHNTVLAVSHLAKRILSEYPGTEKLSPTSIAHFSATLWSTIRMSEVGIPFDLQKLQELETTLLIHTGVAINAAAGGGVLIEGEGSAQSQREFVDRCIEEITALHPDFLSHPLLTYTDKKKNISWNSENRRLIASHLPDNHPAQRVFKAADSHALAQKIVSSYTFPLLRHKRANAKDKNSIAIPIPHRPDRGIAYPTWYTVPSIPKDTGSEGGTIQARITCKNPAAQTFPPMIKACEASRYKGGSIISFDLSQIELRVAAVLSGDPTLLAAFNNGEDLHTKRALAIFGPNQKPEDAARNRQIGKTINFADLFGASANRLQRSVLDMSGMLFPKTFFEKIVRDRYLFFPTLLSWQHSLCATAETDGCLQLPFTGHSRTFTNFHLDHNAWKQRHELKQVLKRNGKSMISEVLNFPVQTTAGNVMLAIQNHIHQSLGPLSHPNTHKQPQMFLQVYDALYFDCPPQAEGVAQELMRNAVHDVSHHGLWNKLCNLTGHHVPLTYE